MKKQTAGRDRSMITIAALFSAGLYPQLKSHLALGKEHGITKDEAVEAGNEAIKIRVAEKKIGFCSACYYCRQSGGVCAKKDDMADILQKMIDADVIVLASPVYFYSIDAQMKALIDRTLARWTEVKNKEFYYIVTCADRDKKTYLSAYSI